MIIAKKRVTIKDVADRAGVSYQTVSRVINNHDSVSDETRRNVLAAIDELDYRPSLAARSLPGRRSYVIGFVVPYDPDYLIRDPHLLAQISGADAEANSHDYNVLLSTAGDSINGVEAYERMVRNQVADGALAVETACIREGSDLLARQNYPYVSLGYDLSDPNAHVVHTDDRAGARDLTRHLLEKGHRRIGIINGPAIGAVATIQERLDGHREALVEAGIQFNPQLMLYGDYTRAYGYQAAKKFIELSDRPTAIFAMNDRMALGAIRAVIESGLRVPDDVAVVGFDDIPMAADYTPSLTTVRQPSRELGVAAAQLLFDMIDGKPIERREIVLPAEVIIRESS